MLTAGFRVAHMEWIGLAKNIVTPLKGRIDLQNSKNSASKSSNSCRSVLQFSKSFSARLWNDVTLLHVFNFFLGRRISPSPTILKFQTEADVWGTPLDQAAPDCFHRVLVQTSGVHIKIHRNRTYSRRELHIVLSTSKTLVLRYTSLKILGLRLFTASSNFYEPLN